tara:strand:- start:139 stop:447 length:309 start_codon:yes stop_codon:yes gene_type:complete
MRFFEIIKYYREGMNKYDNENPSTFKNRLEQVIDEFDELIEDKNIEELIDVLHTIGRLFHKITGLHLISYLAWPTVKKHAKRYKKRRCIRSERNCKKYCIHI